MAAQMLIFFQLQTPAPCIFVQLLLVLLHPPFISILPPPHTYTLQLYKRYTFGCCSFYRTDQPEELDYSAFQFLKQEFQIKTTANVLCSIALIKLIIIDG